MGQKLFQYEENRGNCKEERSREGFRKKQRKDENNETIKGKLFQNEERREKCKEEKKGVEKELERKRGKRRIRRQGEMRAVSTRSKRKSNAKGW
jgi:hypothetical protein